MSTPPRLNSNLQSGLRWTAIRQIIVTVFSSIGVVVYTRYLLPEDLGAMALVNIVYGGLILFVQAPLRDAIIYFRDDETAYGNAAFWLLVGGSVVGGGLVLVLADVFARAYETPEAAGLTRAMVIAFFLQAMAVVPSAFLLKKFRFALHESLQMANNLILIFATTGFAIAGFGAWAFVYPQIMMSLFYVVAVWWVSFRLTEFMPAFPPSNPHLRHIIRYSRAIFGSKVVTYLRVNIDQIGVGRLGTQALGWYSFGEARSAEVVITLGIQVAQVALPALAEARKRLAEFQQILLDTMRLSATLSMPLQIGALVLADLGIAIFFGENWIGAVSVIRAYLFFRVVQVLLEICDSATSAIGRPEVTFWVDAGQLPFFIAGTFLSLRLWGTIEAVAWTLAAVRLLAGLVYLALTMRVAQISHRQVGQYLLPSTLSATLMGLLVYGVRLSNIVPVDLTATATQNVTDFVVLVSLGVIAYIALLFAFDRHGFVTVWKMALSIFLPNLGNKKPPNSAKNSEV